AYDPKIDRKRWTSVREQWQVWRHDAEGRAELCKTEGLPEPQLTEIFQKLRSVDHRWEIACDYRADHKSTPVQKRKPGPKTTVRRDLEEAMRKDFRNRVIGSNEKIEYLIDRYKSKFTSTQEAYNKVRAEFIGNSNSDK